MMPGTSVAAGGGIVKYDMPTRADSNCEIVRVYGGASCDSEPEPTTLGGKIRRRRRALGLTQAQAAERLGTSGSDRA